MQMSVILGPKRVSRLNLKRPTLVLNQVFCLFLLGVILGGCIRPSSVATLPVTSEVDNGPTSFDCGLFQSAIAYDEIEDTANTGKFYLCTQAQFEDLGTNGCGDIGT